MAALSDNLRLTSSGCCKEQTADSRPEFVESSTSKFADPLFSFSAVTPHEVAAENIRMQRADEDTDAPKRRLLLQAFAGFRHHPGPRRGPRPIDGPVGNLLQFGRVHEACICGASPETVKTMQTDYPVRFVELCEASCRE